MTRIVPPPRKIVGPAVDTRTVCAASPHTTVMSAALAVDMAAAIPTPINVYFNAFIPISLVTILIKPLACPRILRRFYGRVSIG
jgi:hypothetical protein